MKKYIHFIALNLIFLSALLSCNYSTDKQKNNNEKEENKMLEIKIDLAKSPDFIADSAYYFIEQQVKMGFRVPNTEGHKKCAAFLVKTLENSHWTVQVQDFDAIAFDGTVLKSKNIIATFNPKAGKRIMLAAHWDSRPFADKDKKDKNNPIVGANDGASGVGILLEIARIVSQSENKPNLGIDIVLFDSEDYGQPEDFKGEYKQDMWCLGSQYWSKNKHQANYSAYFGILLDMVGAKDAKFYKEGTSMQYAPVITNQIWKTAELLGYQNYFINQNSPSIVDDHAYVNKIAKIPMLDIIQFEPMKSDSYFADYHHTHNDNLQVIDRNTLKAVGQTVLQVLYQEGQSN